MSVLTAIYRAWPDAAARGLYDTAVTALGVAVAALAAADPEVDDISALQDAVTAAQDDVNAKASTTLITEVFIALPGTVTEGNIDTAAVAEERLSGGVVS